MMATEKPILFSGAMIRAILAGAKSQTRRVIKPHPLFVGDPDVPFKTPDADPEGIIKCPYGKVGDFLWVRETFAYIWPGEYHVPEYLCDIEYRADTTNRMPGDWPYEERSDPDCPKWKPSIFMPRALSRINLEITGIRVERLNDISEKDAICEGISPCGITIKNATIATWKDYLGRTGAGFESPKESFWSLWDSINGKPKAGKPDYSWSQNPYVWIVEFKKK